MTTKALGLINAFTIPPLTVINSHFEEMFLNPPERILSEIDKIKREKKRLDSMEAGLKQELENHYQQNHINGKFISDGVMAIRQRREGKWEYTEATETLEAQMKQEIEGRKAEEREDGIARQNEPSFSWAIRAEK
jgi:hypothetical protein